MAIYSVQVKSLSRGKGDSATAAAAYRAGLCLDDPSGARHDYSKKGGVLSVDMLAPDGAPAWATDPHQLWAKVEEHETRKNARVAREVLAALPHELTPEQRRGLAKDLGQLLVERYGVAAQVALHAPDKGGDNRNFHAHILITPRQVGPDGFGNSAAKVLDEFKAGAQELKDLRAAIGARINAALAAAGVASRVDHRRLNEQKADALERGDFGAVARLDRLPTKHEGKAVTQARRRGERLPRAKRNDRARTASERRLNQHTRRFEDLKAKAAAEGRLQQVDEQALHARALLERTREGCARLAQAIQPTPPRAAVQARAKKPHKAGASKPRQAPIGGGQQGKVSAAVERVARSRDRVQVENVVMQEAAKQLEALIEEMLARARRALQQPEATPWQRATARTLLETHDAAGEARETWRRTVEERKQAREAVRRARADRGHYGPPADDPFSRVRRALGRPTAHDRQALEAAEAVRRAKAAEAKAKVERDAASRRRQQAEAGEEKARANFAKAFELPMPTRPEVKQETPNLVAGPPRSMPASTNRPRSPRFP
ncbi:MobA/MobL family protein [Stenotrophomonas maltophilia]|uniref:MobA/MobL family protein n=1 Tax=Stenotrophomonas maltophilia TaxID=40324 RepID=UPI003100AA58